MLTLCLLQVIKMRLSILWSEVIYYVYNANQKFKRIKHVCFQCSLSAQQIALTTNCKFVIWPLGSFDSLGLVQISASKETCHYATCVEIEV